jgi:hypothetical protein
MVPLKIRMQELAYEKRVSMKTMLNFSKSSALRELVRIMWRIFRAMVNDEKD